MNTHTMTQVKERMRRPTTPTGFGGPRPPQRYFNIMRCYCRNDQRNMRGGQGSDGVDICHTDELQRMQGDLLLFHEEGG